MDEGRDRKIILGKDRPCRLIWQCGKLQDGRDLATVGGRSIVDLLDTGSQIEVGMTIDGTVEKDLHGVCTIDRGIEKDGEVSIAFV